MRAIAISTALIAANLLVGSAVAQQQQLTGTGQFCIKGATGPVKCEYQTMARCEQARPAVSSDQCVSRAQAQGTIGGPALREEPSAPGQQKD